MTRNVSSGIDKILSEVSQPSSPTSKYSIDGLIPRAVVEPKNETELSAVLRIAEKYSLKVIAVGGGNDLGLGNIPTGLDLVVLTSGLSRIIRYVPEDLTISVQCGLTLDEAQMQLANKNQMVPITHPGSNPTFGGIIASNSAVPPIPAHGSIRDILLGVKVANAGGTITKAGSNVVKNVAGYDLSKLYIGSLGTLGLILEATLKILAAPEYESTILIFSNSLRDLNTIASGVNIGYFPYALVLVNYHFLEHVHWNFGSSFQNFGYSLFVLHTGSNASISEQSRLIERMVMKYPQIRTEILLNNESRKLWARFGSNPEMKLFVKFRISVPPADTATAIIQAEEEFEYFKPKIFADPSRGIISSSIRISDDSHLLVDRLKHLRKSAETLSGNLVLESAPSPIKKEIDVWGTLPNGFGIMRKIKEKFDPNQVLSPGRFIGGI